MINSNFTIEKIINLYVEIRKLAYDTLECEYEISLKLPNEKMQTVVTYEEEEFLEFYNEYFNKFDIIDNKIIINETHIFISIYGFIFWLSKHAHIVGLRHKGKDILLLLGNKLEIDYTDIEYSCRIMTKLNDKMLSSVSSMKELGLFCYGTTKIAQVSPCFVHDLTLFRYNYPINYNVDNLSDDYFDPSLSNEIVYNLNSEIIVQKAYIAINLRGGINDTFKKNEEKTLNYIKDNMFIDDNFIVFPDITTYGVTEIKGSFMELKILCVIFPRIYYQHTIGYEYDILNGFKNSFKDVIQIQQWIKNRWNIVTDEVDHGKICNISEELICKSIFSGDYVYH